MQIFAHCRNLFLKWNKIDFLSKLCPVSSWVCPFWREAPGQQAFKDLIHYLKEITWREMTTRSGLKGLKGVAGGSGKPPTKRKQSEYDLWCGARTVLYLPGQTKKPPDRKPFEGGVHDGGEWSGISMRMLHHRCGQASVWQCLHTIRTCFSQQQSLSFIPNSFKFTLWSNLFVLGSHICGYPSVTSGSSILQRSYQNENLDRENIKLKFVFGTSLWAIYDRCSHSCRKQAMDDRPFKVPGINISLND